ncbi:MAG TPA: response regulator [Polyangiaceae bacterium]|jgi:CheY-like chemotaxis protein|nr:response regulator [Polyangiaceae bacterium]
MTRDIATPVKLRVLIVDDYADAADLLAEALSFAGYEVRTANDGPAALEIFEQESPAAAFIDIGMPGMDGYEVARKLREGPGASAFLVALTGRSGDAERLRSVAAGFDLHLVKPVDLSKVAALLEEKFGA